MQALPQYRRLISLPGYAYGPNQPRYYLLPPLRLRLPHRHLQHSQEVQYHSEGCRRYGCAFQFGGWLDIRNVPDGLEEFFFERIQEIIEDNGKGEILLMQNERKNLLSEVYPENIRMEISGNEVGIFFDIRLETKPRL